MGRGVCLSVTRRVEVQEVGMNQLNGAVRGGENKKEQIFGRSALAWRIPRHFLRSLLPPLIA